MTTNIYYDGDCPFCRRYVDLLRLREAAGEVRLISLREAPEAYRRFEAKGLDLDQGMVVEQSGRLYHGREAIHRLALMTTRVGLFNRITAAILSRHWLATLLYPLMRAVRNATLLIMGRQPLKQRNEDELALLQVAGRFFGLFSILHVIIYLFRYTPLEGLPTSPLVFLFGLYLFLSPASVRAWVLLVLVLAIDAWLQAPLASNHTILKNFWLLALLLGGSYAWLRGVSFETFFQRVRPVGQALLVVMYFYGVFHKINTGFLDPEVSCAVELWHSMPPFLTWLDATWFRYLAIYGTLVIEAAIVLALLIPRTRHLGIVAGIGFHGLLALSGYAMYAPFTTLTIFFHLLFLSPDGALQVVRSTLWQFIDRTLRKPIFIFLLLALFILMVFSAVNRDFVHVSFLWLVVAAPLLLCIVVHGRGKQHQSILWSRWHWLNIVSLAFLLNGAMPYLGLKTAQTLNMFANLRLEGGVSNHLLIREPLSLFGYLDDLAEVRHADPEFGLGFFMQRDDSLIVYYDLLNRMERHPEATVSYIRGGVDYDDMTFADVREEAEQLLHSPTFRKYFHFRWVRDSEKITCDLSPPWQPPAG
ncbi:DUF393 domain-containing protein [Halomonas sp. TRM85114]|uniref:DCC1-like thiol-disulfide oxidoreductase family protein n=1 Tax=Halomonas jincaotanensis TaxID=2810616 RepID=UPI001BD64185|nr:DCC1-like thiol-disulfide oxidoreductase family protein [Halomonas jincaotanensis]MBS9405243.1 DUF393 domain-containing protein [Halomonas jincaotanensis]